MHPFCDRPVPQTGAIARTACDGRRRSARHDRRTRLEGLRLALRRLLDGKVDLADEEEHLESRFHFLAAIRLMATAFSLHFITGAVVVAIVSANGVSAARLSPKAITALATRPGATSVISRIHPPHLQRARR